MPTRVDMPKLGQTVEEASIVRWIKQEGDQVKTADILCEVQTDKATLEVESWSSGTLLKIVAAVDKVIPVGGLIAVIGEPGEQIPPQWLGDTAFAVVAESAPVEAAPETVAAVDVQTVSAPAGRMFASPRAKATAVRQLVPLTALRGTGPNGRIIERDVLAHAEKASAIKTTPLARKLAFERGVDLLTLAADGGKIDKAAVLAAKPASTDVPLGEDVPLSKMRQVVAERMSQSRREIPCFHCGIDVDMTDAVALRESRRGPDGKAMFAYGDLILKAAALSLAKFGPVNSLFAGDHIHKRSEINVGFAVSLEEGLIVPVIQNADRKTIADIAAESVGLAAKARSKQLGPDEYTGGCLTVSNLGGYGIEWFIPIVNPGESAILGVSAIAEKVVAVDGMIAIRKRMTLVGSFDHRVVDGAVGAAFLAEVKRLLEECESLFES